MAAAPATLPLLDMPAPAVKSSRRPRTSTSDKPVVRRNGRVTSVQMRPQDDAVLTAFLAKLGGNPSDAIRYALHRAAEADGLAVDAPVRGAAA